MANFFNIVSYSFKVWITSVLVAPALYIFVCSFQHERYQLSSNESISNQLQVYAVFVLISAILSFCTWLLFIAAIKLITLIGAQLSPTKVMVLFAGLLLSAGTFAVLLPFSFTTYNEFFVLMLANCICIGVGSWFYKLEIENGKINS